MTLANTPTFDIKEFTGIRNKHNPRRLPLGALVAADNIDIDDYKGLVLREGFSQSRTHTAITASFATHDERRLFIVENGDLFLLGADLTPVLLQTGLGDERIYWLEIADFVLLSTGHVIDKDNRVSSWRVDTPPPSSLEVIAGNLAKGDYHVVTTYVDKTGREGAASPISVITLDAESGLRITPETIADHVTRVYMTDTNGTVYYQVSASNNEVSVLSLTGFHAVLDTVQLKTDTAPENIGCLAYYASRLYMSEMIAGNSYVWFSEPFWWNLFNLQGDYIAIPGRVNALIGTPQGLIIATDDEIYVYTSEDALVRVAEYGVPQGVPYTANDTGKFYLLTHQGLCEFFPFNNLTESKLGFNTGELVYLKYMNQRGYDKIVILLDGQKQEDNKFKGHF